MRRVHCFEDADTSSLCNAVYSLGFRAVRAKRLFDQDRRGDANCRQCEFRVRARRSPDVNKIDVGSSMSDWYPSNTRAISYSDAYAAARMGSRAAMPLTSTPFMSSAGRTIASIAIREAPTMPILKLRCGSDS